MAIDWTINVTGILGILTVTLGGIWAAFTVQADIRELKSAAQSTKAEIGELAKAITQIALADERIAGLGRRLDDEKHEGAEWRHWVRAEFTRAWSAIAKKVDRQGGGGD